MPDARRNYYSLFGIPEPNQVQFGSTQDAPVTPTGPVADVLAIDRTELPARVPASSDVSIASDAASMRGLRPGTAAHDFFVWQWMKRLQSPDSQNKYKQQVASSRDDAMRSANYHGLRPGSPEARRFIQSRMLDQ